MNKTTTTQKDREIINATSVALKGRIGGDNDIERLRKQIEEGGNEDGLHVACEIAVAFIRWAQDLKSERDRYKSACESHSTKQVIARAQLMSDKITMHKQKAEIEERLSGINKALEEIDK